jgi:hypothetical protein
MTQFYIKFIVRAKEIDELRSASSLLFTRLQMVCFAMQDTDFSKLTIFLRQTTFTLTAPIFSELRILNVVRWMSLIHA